MSDRLVPPESNSDSIDTAAYEIAIENMVNLLTRGELPKVSAPIRIPRLRKDGQVHELANIAEYFFERDQDWWSIFGTKLIEEVKYYNSDGTPAQDDNLKTNSFFTQRLHLPFFGEVNHLVKVGLIQDDYYQTIAVPFGKSVPLSYVATFLIKENANTIDLTLEGSLYHPRFSKKGVMSDVLIAPINILTRFAMGVMLGNRLKSGEFVSALRRNQKTGEQ